MRGFWPLFVVGALLLTPCVRGDPAVSSPGPGLGMAAWTFSNPANYTAVNATVHDAATLAWTTSGAMDTSEADFAAAVALENANLTASPGDVRIDNTSEPGPILNLTWQPGPSNLSDNSLNNGNGGKLNYGTSPELISGNWGGGSWWRVVLRFPALPLPANATLVSAQVQLYFYDPIVPDVMFFSAHRVLDSWSDLESSWVSRNATLLWTNPGGDFDSNALDTSAGVGTTPGWFTWNVTGLAQGWWTGTIANDGLLIRQAGDTVSLIGNKGFYGADATNASLRPRLLLGYTTPSSHAHLESRVLDAGSRATWARIWWNDTVPAGTGLAVRTRSGDVFPTDASWSPWSVPVNGPGAVIASPAARYLQYALDLFTPSAISPACQDVSVGWGRYAANGRVETADFSPSPLAGWGVLSLNATTPAGTSASLAYSQDGGVAWTSAGSGTNLSSALVTGLRIRIVLVTTDTTVAPVVHGVSLTYWTTSVPGPGPTDGASNLVLVWFAGLVLAGILAALLIAYRQRTTAFRPTGLFLIHADGRLIARVGREEMGDELAASAMFTLVLRFVRDSFRGPGGTGGELKSLQVDEREVSIARGRFVYLALVSQGPRPPQLSARMYGFLAKVEADHGGRLEHWDGIRDGNESLEADLARFLERGSRRGRIGGPDGYRA